MVENCTKIVNHSLVKVEENKRKAIFRNPGNKEYRVSKIDGCLIHNGVRADCLVSEINLASVLVELKGVDVAHACEQLLASASHPKVKELLERRIGFLVVCSKYPRFDTYVLRAKQKCAKLYKAGFHVVCDKGEFDLDKVASIKGP